MDGDTWLVYEPFIYDSIWAGLLTVPALQTTDFNSIPRFLWSILPPARYAEAGVVHDWAYRTGSLTRKLADDVFLEILTILRAPAWKRYAMYRAVRMFGGGAYRG